MTMKTLLASLMAVCTLVALNVTAQDKKEIDASKPTNFYNSVNTALEYISRSEGGNQMGVRFNLVLAPSDRHLILGEIPLIYNDQSKGFGLGDVRARYFYLPYKNYSRFFGALGPSIDIIAPTGSASKGLGTGRWTIAPGIAMGLMFSEKVQVFPILSYNHMSRPVYTDDSPSAAPINSASLQFVTVIVLTEKAYINFTPQFAQNYQNKQGSFSYIQEATLGYQVNGKTLLALYTKRDFHLNITQVSFGYTRYF